MCNSYWPCRLQIVRILGAARSCLQPIGYSRSSALLAAVVTLTACSAARPFDTAPSVTGNLSKAAYTESEYPNFVQKWLGKSNTTLPQGAFASHEFTIEPPTRPGYNRVGGKELDDALTEFANWCLANGGKPVAYAVAGGIDPRLIHLLQQPLTEIRDGAYRGCERGSLTFALIFSNVDRSVTNRAAMLTVTHYTQPSIAQAAASRKEAVRVGTVRNQEAHASADRRAREQDMEYRKSLKIGDTVRWDRDIGAGFAARGLVIELRPPIALIQFDNLTPSSQWVRIDTLRRPL